MENQNAYELMENYTVKKRFKAVALMPFLFASMWAETVASGFVFFFRGVSNAIGKVVDA